MDGIKWLFFDIGSTLADESLAYEEIYRKIAKTANKTYDFVYEKALEYYKQNKRGDKEVSKLLGVEKPIWEPQYERLYDDAKECLERLSRKYKIGIIANQIPGTEQRLEKFGIRKYIDVIVASAEEGVAKPDRRMFEIALERAKCLADQAAMIGDRIDYDIVPAKNMGMKTIWVKQGMGQYWIFSDESERPDYEVDSLSELLDIMINPDECRKKELQLGFAETDITPKKPTKLVGFYRGDSLSKGVLEPLMAQVAVLKSEETCCLIAIDSIGFTLELSNALRERVGRLLNVTPERVMLCFSHTHAAPDAYEEQGYYEDVCNKIEECVSRAKNNLSRVSVGWDNAIEKIGVNRRWISKDTDDRIGILKMCDERTGYPKLLILRVTAHGNVLKRDNHMVSPDYFGDVRKVAGQRFKCPVMVIQGAAGSTAPKYFCSKETPVDSRSEECVRSENALVKMANLITESVSEKFNTIITKKELSVNMCSKWVTLISDVPSSTAALHIAEEAKTMCGIENTGWIEKVEALNKAGVREQRENIEIQFLSIGEWCMCGGPYEFMVGFALETSRILQNEFFYMNGYTNGCLLYFPTEEEYDAGGYEVFWSMLIYYKYLDRVFAFRREEAKKLIKSVVDFVNEDDNTRNKLSDI